MNWSWIYLAVTLVGASFTLNAYIPTRRHMVAVVPSFFASWITIEMAAFHIAWQAVATAIFAYLGAFDAWPGWLGLAITLASWAGLLLLMRQSGRTHAVVERALSSALGDDYRTRIRPEIAGHVTDALGWRHLLLPLLFTERDVEAIRNLSYGPAGRRNSLDVYRPKGTVENAPVLLQIHGGGWTVGSKQQQAQPLMRYLASRGWVCVAANYRLSPKVAFPDHLIDVKRALAWIREHIAEYGGDPGFVVATGGSAGGHLSALMTLTGNEERFQPGFEEADTSIQAGVPMYGLFDVRGFEDEKWGKGFDRFFTRVVMRATREEAPDLYRDASPAAWLRSDSPPMFIVHGDKDVLLPVTETRRFVQTARQTMEDPVVYAELPGGQHAFDVFWSVRTGHVVAGITRFLLFEYSRYLDGLSATDTQPSQRAASG
ncbi:MAG: alpha/beta hydrolase [Acidimicrobiia bacterium]|nr:alpha/beta hydrolase [Acidimicrobiia bacterium]